LITLGIVDYFLESPDYFNKEIIFKKDFETKFLHASLDFHRSLSCQDLRDIYIAILGTRDSCYIIDKLYNTTGFYASYDSSSESFIVDSCLMNAVSLVWQNNNLKTRFISEKDSVVEKSRTLNHFKGVVSLSPVKLINDKAYVGYNWYCGPWCGCGFIFEIYKSNDKWIAKPFKHTWIA
jgi:hypothetical protein